MSGSKLPWIIGFGSLFLLTGLIIGLVLVLIPMFRVSTPVVEDPPVVIEDPVVMPEIRRSSIGGVIWHDLCAQAPGQSGAVISLTTGCVQHSDGRQQANGLIETGELGIPGVLVHLGSGECPSRGLASTLTGSDGTYQFAGLEPGGYCIEVDSADAQHYSALTPGWWTRPSGLGSGSLAGWSVSLAEGEERRGLDFGWDYQLLPEAIVPTEEPVVAPPVTSDPLSLGSPTWHDTFANGNNWPLYEDEHVRFRVKDGDLSMRAFNADGWDGWMLTWPVLSDLYVELDAENGDCAGRDRYGVMVRATKTSKGYIGYLFGVSCDGRYSLRSWDGVRYTRIIDWTASEHIRAGADAQNRIGLMAQGDTITLFVNGGRVAQIVDKTHLEGKLGLFVGATETEDFSVRVAEMSIWDLSKVSAGEPAK